MRKLFALAAVAGLAIAAPASAAEFGIAIGAGGSQSSSAAGAASAGGSASAIFGVTAQQSSAGAQSQGGAVQVINGNDSAAASNHTSVTEQQGTSASFGLAASRNGNIAVANGASSAGNRLVGVWLFGNP